VVEQPESQSALSLGLGWASRVTTIGFGFAVPVMIGYGVDRWLRTIPVATITGAVLGFVTGMVQVLKIAGEDPSRRKRRAIPPPGDREAPGSQGKS